MADISGWTTLKKIVQEIMFETDKPQANFKKFMHHVINGVRDLNMYHFNNLKTTKLTANDIGAISMPSDFVSFLALSVQDGGKLWTITKDDELIPTTTGTPETLDSDVGEGVAVDTGTNYGYRTTGAKNDFYFTVDHRNNRFLVRNTPGTTKTFFLQYVSAGIDPSDGNSALIPVKLKDPLKWYALYKDALASDFGNKNLVGMYKNEYREEVSKLRFLELPTADEIRDIIYSTYEIMRR
jgi:hypothetical protein